MKTISKNYKTLKQAEKYQNWLYGRYDYVRLVSSPRWSEEGVYVWEVRKGLANKGN